MITDLLGSTEPRIYTPTLYPYSLGDVAKSFATDVMELTLMPWQSWLLDHALELREPWTDFTLPPPFRYRTVLVMVARQNGKTVMLRVRALAGMFLWREQLAVSLAQNRDVAFEPWRAAAITCETVPTLKREVRTVARSNGKECIELRNGARWKVTAATSGPRGLSADAVFIDELREQRDYTALSAVDYARSAHRHSQLWAFSNAGDVDSMVLNDYQRIGHACADDPERDPSFGLFEWSAEDDADVADPRAWCAANPALGRMLTEPTIRAELARQPYEEFITERLCIRVTNLTAWLAPGLWADLERADATVPDDVVPTFAVDAAPDLSLAVIAVGAPLPDGNVHVELAAAVDATHTRPAALAAAEQLRAMLSRYPGAEAVYDASGPIAGTMADLTRAGLPVRALTADEVRKACATFRELCTNRKLVHRADVLLAEHVANAAPNDYGNSWTFTRRRQERPVTALVTVVLVADVARHPTPRARWTVF